MVLVEDVTDNNASSSAQSSSTNTNTNSSQNRQSELNKFIMNDKISVLLYFTRLLTLVFTFFFIVPITGYDLNALYQKAMLASAATSALKLHQRISGIQFQFSRVYFANLTVEDSFHYLLYALIFMNNFPVTIALMPVVGFALLHYASYTKTLLNLGGVQNSILNRGINAIISKDKDLMRFVAINEILMFPTVLVLIFSGKCGLFVPFIYYRFLCMRYQSRRNPYNRIMFYEMRIILEHYTSQPNCPAFLRNLTSKFIALVTRLAPQQTA